MCVLKIEVCKIILLGPPDKSMNLKIDMTTLRQILVGTQILSLIPVHCWEQVGTLRPPEALTGFKERLSEIVNYG